MPKNKKPPVQKTKPPALNLSVRREVLDAVGDFLSALIVELINYRFIKNDKKPVWLKIDWIHDKLPYITRSGLAKKLDKLIRDGHIIKKEGEGRHYHKIWFSPSPDMREACAGKGIHLHSGKVYYNPKLAEENIEASVIYAAIGNLLKVEEAGYTDSRGGRVVVGRELGRVDDKLLLDYSKLAEGSGLPISKVRKAVKWLIDNRKIAARSVFGNKKQVWVPPTSAARQAEEELPSESYPHTPEEDRTEY
jgi:hypothetical protein